MPASVDSFKAFFTDIHLIKIKLRSGEAGERIFFGFKNFARVRNFFLCRSRQIFLESQIKVAGGRRSTMKKFLNHAFFVSA